MEHSPYPMRRALPLLEAISHDFNDQLLRVLVSHRLMYMDYAKFEDIMTLVTEVFGTWDENMKDFTNVAREGKPDQTFVLPLAEVSSITEASRKVHFHQD